jgi:hypothetical protein
MKSLVGRCIVRGLLVLTTVTALLAAAAILPAETMAKGADKWASSLDSSRVSHFVRPEAIAALPVEYRKALFASLQTPEGRAEFWRAVFTQYRRTHTLTKEADALLRVAEQSLTLDLFTGRRKLASDDPILLVKVQIAKVLGKQAAEELFTTAGPAEISVAGLPTVEAARVLWRVKAVPFVQSAFGAFAPAVSAVEFNHCNCNRSYSREDGCLGDCAYHTRCGEDLNDCETSGWGCGPFWMYGCDGVCYYPEGAGPCPPNPD